MFVSENKPDLIIEKLYLGCCICAENQEYLKNKKITHILVVGNYLKQNFPDDFKYKQIFINDMINVNIKKYFEETNSFIKEGIEKGSGILVHCAAGISRSASCVIAFLMKEKGMNFSEAFNFVQTKRDKAFPNIGFIRQLKDYEKELNF